MKASDEMGNFCMSDEGRNGIADRKHKKISSLGSPFLPKGPKGPRAKMVTLEARGMIFFLLKCGKTIYAQVTYAEIAFIYSFSGNNNSGKTRAENAFSDHPVQKTFSGKCFSDQSGRNFFEDRSAKQFLPAGNNISG